MPRVKNAYVEFEGDPDNDKKEMHRRAATEYFEPLALDAEVIALVSVDRFNTAVEGIKAQLGNTYWSLLEATAWMGIPEKKREAFINTHVSNGLFIANKTLAEIGARPIKLEGYEPNTEMNNAFATAIETLQVCKAYFKSEGYDVESPEFKKLFKILKQAGKK